MLLAASTALVQLTLGEALTPSRTLCKMRPDLVTDTISTYGAFPNEPRSAEGKSLHPDSEANRW